MKNNDFFVTMNDKELIIVGHMPSGKYIYFFAIKNHETHVFFLTSGKYAVLDIEHKASDHFCKKQQGL